MAGKMINDSFDLEEFRVKPEPVVEEPKRQKAERRWKGSFSVAVSSAEDAQAVLVAIRDFVMMSATWSYPMLEVTDNIVTGTLTYQARSANAADCRTLVEKHIEKVGTENLSGVRLQTIANDKLGDGR